MHYFITEKCSPIYSTLYDYISELTWSKDEKGQEGGSEDDLCTTSIEVLCKCRQEKTKIVPKTKAMVDLKMFWVSNRVLGIKSRPFYTTCSCSGITCIPCIHRLIDFTQSCYKKHKHLPKPFLKKRDHEWRSYDGPGQPSPIRFLRITGMLSTKCHRTCQRLLIIKQVIFFKCHFLLILLIRHLCGQRAYN